MIVLVGGTRPEVIKLAMLWRELQARGVAAEYWHTGQHGSLALGMLDFFGITPTRSWPPGPSGESSNALLGRMLRQLDEALVEHDPKSGTLSPINCIVVQGDTTSALAGALTGFHRGIAVAHVEAGLRSGDLAAPFPEEMNRCVIDRMATWCFPPTSGAEARLRAEGNLGRIAPATGNTGIDALRWTRTRMLDDSHWPAQAPRLGTGDRLILSTGHRREHLGPPLIAVLSALAAFVQSHPGWRLIHASHPNPAALRCAETALAGRDRVHVLPALDYPDFVAVLAHADVVVTDSGGIQEEAPGLGIPVLITRTVTERPEVLEHGGMLVGVDPDALRAALERIASLPQSVKPEPQNLFKTPFGDGFAARRIADILIQTLGGPIAE